MMSVVSLKDMKLKKKFEQVINAPEDDELDKAFPAILSAGKELRNHPGYMLELIKLGKAKIFDASPDLRDNEDFMSEAVKDDLEGYKNASDRLKSSGRLAFKAIEACALNILHVSPCHPLYDDLVVEVLMQDGAMLSFLSEERQSDFDTVLVAVRNDGAALRYASPELIENEILAMEAVKNNGYALDILPEHLKVREDFKIAAQKSIDDIHRRIGEKYGSAEVLEFKEAD